MRERRQNAIKFAIDTFTQHAIISHRETFTREKSENTLGKSWTNILDITVDSAESIRRLKIGVKALRREGYIISVECDDEIIVHVSTSYEVNEMFSNE